MYQVFRNIISKPITIVICLILVLLLFFSISSSFTSLMTWFGMETKENVQEKLVNTETQLDKAIDIIKTNEADKVLNEKIVEANKEIAKEAVIADNKITEDENKILEEMSKIVEPVVKPTVDSNTKPVAKKVVSNKPKAGDICNDSNELSYTQIKKLELLVLRSQQLKGASK